MSRRESFKDAESATYWFPAKRFGWGWGLPTTWQGWAVLIAFLTLEGLAAAVWFPPDRQPTEFTLVTLVLTVVFIAVCWRKGEPPRRSGSHDR